MNLVNILAVELAPLDERRLGRCDCPLLSTRSPCARSFTRAEQLLQRLGSDSHAGGRPFLSFKIIHFESEKYLFSQMVHTFSFISLMSEYVLKTQPLSFLFLVFHFEAKDTPSSMILLPFHLSIFLFSVSFFFFKF